MELEHLRAAIIRDKAKPENENLNKSYRNFCFTLNNPIVLHDENGKKHEPDRHILEKYAETRKNITYIIFGIEKGEECGTPHFQGYVEFRNSVKLSTIKRYGGPWARMHISPRRGTAKQASDYCAKGEQTKAEWNEFREKGPNWGLNAIVFEDGEMSNQGVRNDLIEAVERLKDGEIKDVNSLAINEPKLYHIYGRTLAKAESEMKKKITRESLGITTEGIFFFGPTGVGKSSAARELCLGESIYIWKKDSPWQDMYEQQDNVIIDEFRGNTMKYSDLLEITDKWNYSVDRRYVGPIPFISKRLIITSSMAPWECFCNLSEQDKLDQLERRFIVLTRKNIKDNWIIINEWKPFIDNAKLEKLEKANQMIQESIRLNKNY